MVVELVYMLIMLCIFYSVKFWIDKRRYLKYLKVQHNNQPSLSPTEIYSICKSMIKEGELQLNRFAKNKTLRIVWDPAPKPPNASASIPFLIILTGDWSFLADSNLASKAYLYSTLGHELAHKDNEPLYSFHKSTHNLKNHVREIRADFCGLSFAMNYFDDRNFIILKLRLRVLDVFIDTFQRLRQLGGIAANLDRDALDSVCHAVSPPP